jgi:hypothetical protein
MNYTFCIQVTDPEGDTVFCLWDWGDGSTTEWGGPYSSGEEICGIHAWTNEGIYNIRVKLRDEFGAESPWSEAFCIRIDGTPPAVELRTPQTASLYLLDRRVGACLSTVVFGRITVDVNAVDAVSGVLYVQFFIDNVLQGNITTAPYEWLWAKHAFFRHSIQVTAGDFVGNTASAQIEVWKFF